MPATDGPVYLGIRRSQRLRLLRLLVSGSAAVMLVAALPLSPATLVALLTLVVVAGGRYRRDGRDRPGDVTALVLGSRDTWRVRLRSGAVLQAKPTREALVGPALTVLRLECSDGQKRELVLLPDSVRAEAWRRLRVRLRFPRTADRH